MAETDPCETPWRLLRLARYALAFMVGLVAVAVVGKTISMVLGPGQLKLVIRWWGCIQQFWCCRRRGT
jgi:hypothetical protein